MMELSRDAHRGLQVWLNVALKGFIRLASNERLAEDAIAVNDVRDGASDIGLDVKAGNAGSWIDAAFDDEAVFCEVLLEACERRHFLTAGRASSSPKI